MFEIGLLVFGLLIAIIGAIILIDGASSLAARFGVPQIVIGAVVIGFGTSLPELTVNLSASINGATTMAISNIVGSNIFNLLFIVGLAAIFSPLKIAKSARTKDIPYNLMASVLVLVLGNQLILDHIPYSGLTRTCGIAFMCFFLIYLFYTFSLQLSDSNEDEEELPQDFTVAKSIIFIVLGLVGLVFGGDFIVDGATKIALKFGLSQHLVGLLIVGPGTSVPELIATLAAAFKKRSGLAIGNIMGSNIFNIFFTLGISSIICPLPLFMPLNIAIGMMILASAMIWLFTYLGKREIGKFKGSIFVIVYLAYVAYVIIQS